MHEIVILMLNGLVLGTAYAWAYPKYIGGNLQMATWLDTILMSGLLGISALLYAGDDLSFSLLFTDTNWWIFTLVTAGLIELPLFITWKRRNKVKLWNEGKVYWIEGVTEHEVRRALSDTKYNRIRTRSARLVLVSLALGSVGMVYASAFLGAYPKLSTYLEGIGLLSSLVLYFTLRSSVRIVADAPDDLLDERQIAVRNRAYLLSYRTMFIPIFGLLILQMGNLDMTFFDDPQAGLIDGGALFIATAMLMAALPSIFVALGDKGE